MREGKAENGQSFRRKLTALVFPNAFRQLMLALVSASGALMPGMIAQDPMAAVSLAAQVTFVQDLFPAAFWLKLPVPAVYCIISLDRTLTCLPYTGITNNTNGSGT